MIEADLQFALTICRLHRQIRAVRPSMPLKLCWPGYILFDNNKFAQAKPLLDDIINSGKYSLVPNYDDNFLIATRNNAESIWEIQYAVNDGAGESPNGNYGDALNYPQNVDGLGTCCGFYQPTQNFVNAFKTDANGLPFLDTFNDTNFKNDMGLGSDENFIPDDCTDC